MPPTFAVLTNLPSPEYLQNGVQLGIPKFQRNSNKSPTIKCSLFTLPGGRIPGGDPMVHAARGRIPWFTLLEGQDPMVHTAGGCQTGRIPGGIPRFTLPGGGIPGGIPWFTLPGAGSYGVRVSGRSPGVRWVSRCPRRLRVRVFEICYVSKSPSAIR